MKPRRIAVFRALMLGDLLCATPALRALRRGWPHAHVTLVGLPWAAQWAQRLPWVDDFEPFPGWRGLPEQAVPAPAAARAFVQRMRARDLDLAIQLHGAGELTQAIVALFKARRNAGFASPAVLAAPGDGGLFVPWPAQGHEIERLLAVTDGLGLPRQGLALDWPLRPEDRAHALSLLPFHGRFAIVHPGAQLPSRRWQPERFATVADRLAQRGLDIVLTGSSGESGLTAAVAAAMRHRPAVDLAGRTDLWTLGGLVASADMLVSNDTGLSHMAAALGTPSVVVACGSEVARWAPLDGARHRVLWHDLDCRPCSHRVCPVGHACVEAVNARAVALAATDLLKRKTSDALTTP